MPVPPRPSDTVTRTVKVAAVANAFVGFCSVDVSLSPKSHAYVSVSPSGSVPVAVKAIGTPTRVLPVGVRAAVTVGFWLAVGGHRHRHRWWCPSRRARRTPSPSAVYVPAAV